MKCPYCQKEMQRGYMHDGGAPVQWIPDGKSPALFMFSVAKYGVPLNNQEAWNGYNAEAHYCPDCKIIIAPTES